MRSSIRCHFPLPMAVLALLICADFAAGQSLADVARAEEARRKTLKGSAKVYTDDTLSKGGSGGAAASAPAPAAPTPPGLPTTIAGMPVKPGTEKPAATEEPKPNEPPKDEKYWKERITALRNTLSRNKILAEALQSRVNALSTDFVNRDDPAQRAVIEKDRRAALAEMERVKQDTDKTSKAIVALEDEARRANVPPGWLR